MARVDIDVALLELQSEFGRELTEEPEGAERVVEGMVPDVPGAFVSVDVQVCPAALEPDRAAEVARGPMGVRDLLILSARPKHDIRADASHPARGGAAAAAAAAQRRSVGPEHQALIAHGRRRGRWEGLL